MLISRPLGQQRGFTIIELMTALVILAVAFMLVAPSISTWMQNAHVRTVAESIQDGLQKAHNEALQRNGRVEFTLNTDTSWTVVAHIPGSADETVESRPASEGSSSAVTVTLNPVGATAIFNGLGLLDNAAPLHTVDVAAASATKALRVEITPGGQVRMCDPAVTTSSDPRRCYETP
jgi:type IV fimbrial biogenesis protein FimT